MSPLRQDSSHEADPGSPRDFATTGVAACARLSSTPLITHGMSGLKGTEAILVERMSFPPRGDTDTSMTRSGVGCLSNRELRAGLAACRPQKLRRKLTAHSRGGAGSPSTVCEELRLSKYP